MTLAKGNLLQKLNQDGSIAESEQQRKFEVTEVQHSPNAPHAAALNGIFGHDVSFEPEARYNLVLLKVIE